MLNEVDFKMPEKSAFSKHMPRYPNIWFYVSTDLVRSYKKAIYLVENCLRTYCHLEDDFDLLSKPSEGSDAQARSPRVQPYEDPSDPDLNHDHQLHIRYYISDLAHNKLEKVNLNLDGRSEDHYRVAFSVHWEVATENKNHPYVEFCTICGRSGIYYDVELDRGNMAGDICMKIHDPLGVEFLLYGTIQGQRVFEGDGRKVGSVLDMGEGFDIGISVFSPRRKDMNTPQIGCVLIHNP